MMADLDKETVDFVPNFDETTEEPTVLPTPFPNLLVNGSTGIAVGMATNIPPHNLREVIDGVIALDRACRGQSQGGRGSRPCSRRFPGPDFPTGGFIVGRQGIFQAYTTGRGSITLRAKATTEESQEGRQASRSSSPRSRTRSTRRAAREHRRAGPREEIEGISDLRDESDRDGMRIVIELKRGEVPEVDPQQALQAHAAADDVRHHHAGDRRRPAARAAAGRHLEHFIEFRREVVRRRTEFELRKAEARAHILEGLKIALDHLDAVIKLIRGSKNPAEAREGLMTQFGLSQIQSQAILDMQLQRLTGLERQKIVDELAELLKTIERLRAILSSDELLMAVVVSELKADPREVRRRRRPRSSRRAARSASKT